MLSPEILLNAYLQGIFPMAEDDGEIFWYDPDPRAVIPLDERFHISNSLKRTIKKGHFELRVNRNFVGVMQQCAQRERTWINKEFIANYTELHKHGFAHSVETYFEGTLVGGLYGVSINGLFAGESMFSTMTDASKVALVYLVAQMRERGMTLLDTQLQNDHIAQFGSIEIPRDNYRQLLTTALAQEIAFTDQAPILRLK